MGGSANSAGNHDGYLKLWIDGVLAQTIADIDSITLGGRAIKSGITGTIFTSMTLNPGVSATSSRCPTLACSPTPNRPTSPTRRGPSIPTLPFTSVRRYFRGIVPTVTPPPLAKTPMAT